MPGLVASPANRRSAFPKVYGLCTIHPGGRVMRAGTNDHNPPRFVYITAITRTWLEHNFPKWIIGDESLQQWLTRAFA